MKTKEIHVQMEQLMPLFQEQLNNGRSVKFSPRGSSMLPMLRQGVDSVELSPVPETLKRFDLPLYRRDSGQFVLHRIIATGETFACMGDNQFVPEPGLRRDQIIGLVTAFYRGEKRYPVSHPAYRLYCRFWYHSRHPRHFWRRGISWVRRHLK